MSLTLPHRFARLAKRIQANFTPTPPDLADFPEAMGILVVNRDGDPRAFVVQPFNAEDQTLVLEGPVKYRPLEDVEGLINLGEGLVRDFPGIEYWAVHQYVQTLKLLSAEGYAVHLCDEDDEHADWVLPPLGFVNLTAEVPIVLIQEVDYESFRALLEGHIALDNLPDDVKH